MNLEELGNKWEQDGRLNRTQPAYEAERTPHLHSEYLKLLMKAREAFSRSDVVYKKLYSEKWYYYSMGPRNDEDAKLRAKTWKSMPVRGQKYIKQDLPMTLDGDEDIINAKLVRDFDQNFVQALEEIVKQINNRGFYITGMIEWAKFQAGVK